MIFFDIDNTLLDNDTAQALAATSLYRQNHQLQDHYSEEEFPGIWNDVAETYVAQYMAGKLTFQQQRQARIKEIFKDNLGEQDADTIFKAYLSVYEESWQLYYDVIPMLEKYKDTPKGIISNGDKDQQRQKLKNTGIDYHFEIVVISEDIGVFKPDPKIFLHAAKLAGREPSQCWYVGDNVLTDAKAAMDAGMTGVWLNRRFLGKDVKVPEIISFNDLIYRAS